MLVILFCFKSLFKMKTSMMKIALSEGYKIRTSRTGREFFFMVKRSFLKQALCPHCICITGELSVNHVVLWMSYSSHSQTAWRFPSIYACINIWMSECRNTYMPMYIYSLIFTSQGDDCHSPD